jgi:deoxyribodipyrimidine photo-lyase
VPPAFDLAIRPLTMLAMLSFQRVWMARGGVRVQSRVTPGWALLMRERSLMFLPTRRAALGRLADFVPRAGRDYASGRNTDDGVGAVSRLSPYVRYRMVTEAEIIAAVSAQHGLGGAEKYVQEVLWRSYWKGWLELRPAVWSGFLEAWERARDEFADTSAIAEAEAGCTGIDGFDAWARALVETGYLHNHARMWFASIWIFTLRLPWALGAAFFLRHLIDADAASNTLSWRWVAGLQTAGKTYLATAENIARYTNGRFAPSGLARAAVALVEAPIEAARALPAVQPWDGQTPALLLVHHEDMHPESVLADAAQIAGVVVAADPGLLWGDGARRFVSAAAADTAQRAGAYFGCVGDVIGGLDTGVLIAAAAGVREIVTPYAPVGPVADALARVGPELAREGILLRPVRRGWDTSLWPHAGKGFFAFKQRADAILSQGGLR